ncbi:MAG: hypothetical protein IPI46_10560 [Bacteroidetes bacterium]|nr:hypothetical protein [Bacteroidota bacterium]
MRKRILHQNQFATKIITTLLFFLLPAGLFNTLHAREIKLIKSGGVVDLYYYTHIIDTDLSNAIGYFSHTFVSPKEMVFTEPLPADPNRNWTEMFRVFVNSINSDPEKQVAGVSFKIIIDAPDQNEPMIVGRQIIDMNQTGVQYFAKDLNPIYFDEASNISIQTPSSSSTTVLKSYMRLVDQFLYGSFLGPSQSYQYYEFQYIIQTSPTVGYQWYRSTVNPNASGNDYWDPLLVVGTATLIPGTTLSTLVNPISLNSLSNPNNAIYKHMYDYEMKSNLNAMFTFDECKNISIKDLDLNGNALNMKVGGMWGDVGRQLSPKGIYLSKVEGATISNIDAHHFALDGIELSGQSNGLTIQNSMFENNGRQGFSWTGGINVTATGCHFSFNGKTYVTELNGYLGSSPGAGLDIEPEGCTIPGPGNNYSICGGASNCNVTKDGYFNNCTFKNNAGCEVLNYSSCAAYSELTHNINFTNCTFDDAVHGAENNIWCVGEKFTFDNCNINTNIIYAGTGETLGTETIFKDCHFRDITTDFEIWDDGKTMVSILAGVSKRVKFDNCDFLVEYSKTNMISLGLTVNQCLDQDNWHEIKNCSFNYNYGGLSSSIFQGVKFQGVNTIENSKNETTNVALGPNYLKVNTYQIGIIGGDVCTPSSLNINGQVWHEMVSTSSGPVPIPNDVFEIGVNGYAAYNIGVKALGVIYPTTLINIGANSEFNVKSAGSLWGHDDDNTINNSGQLIFNENSSASLSHATSTIFNSTVINSTNSNSFVYVDNSLSSTFNTYWSAIGITNSSNWFGTYNNPSAPCIQGGNTNLPIGTNVCTSPTTIYSNISTNGPFSIMYNLSNALCHGGNGQIDLSIVGGVAPYVVSLDGGTAMPTNTVSTLYLSAGTYTVAVSDASGCTVTANSTNSFTFSITEPPALVWNTTWTTSPLCNGGNGSIQVLAAGGTGIVQYLLTPGSVTNTTGIFSLLVADNYTITALDANGCTATTTINITEPTLLTASISASSILCQGGSSTITTTANGGTTPYEYSLNGGAFQISNIFNGNVAGNYTITTKDANGCTTISTINITQPALLTASTSASSILCNGGTSTITNTPNGGTTPYEYSLNGGAFQISNIFNSNVAGSYTITVTDANSCSITITLTIIQPPALAWNTTSTTSPLCNGGNGSLQVSTTGGTGIVQYALTPGSVTNTTGNFSSLVAGNYTVTATDANSCSITTTLTIIQPPALAWNTTSTTSPLCNGGNGSLQVSTTGGTGIVQYALTPGSVTNTTGNFSTLVAGNYTITATDANSCSITTTLTIIQPLALAWNTASITSPLCNGGNGSLQVSTTGGTGIVQYALMPGSVTNTNGNFSSLAAGNYTVTATDANSCSITITLTITQPQALSWSSVSFTNVLCNNTPGTITVSTNGGTTPIQYLLMPGNIVSSTGNYNSLLAGTYTIIATDANACQISTTVIINAPTTDHCCSSNASLIISGTPNLILVSNISTNSLISLYNGGNPVFTNKNLYFDGTFTIDQSITFTGCTLWFSPTAQVYLNNTAIIFDVTSSTLQASCDWWGGIVAQDAQNKIIVSSDSYIKNACYGIEALNDAILEASNSHFINNGYQCIRLGNITNVNYPGFVKGCSFATAQNLPPPFNKTGFGIYGINNKTLTIGGLGIAEGNTFDGMRSGIFFGLSNNAINPLLKVYNNSFSNINADYTSSVTPEADLINNCYQTYEGAAIMSYYGGPPGTNAMMLEVKNALPASSGIAITHCDKGIVTIQSSLYAENIYMDYVPMGIMNYNIIGTTLPGGSNSFTIKNNELHNTYLGMQFAGEKLNSLVENNVIDCSLYSNGVQETIGIGTSYIWPKGIDVSYLNNSGTNSFDILNNSISLPHYAGLGIALNNTGVGVAVKDNTVDLDNTNATQIVCLGSTILAGISSNVALGTRIHRNEINGNTAGVFLPADVAGRVDAAGILINKGQEQAIGCNVISDARFGLMAWDDNNTTTTASLKVQGNEVLGADAGWVFRHLANEGTLGNVGSLASDNNNTFTALTTSARVFKFCLGLTPGYEIYTTSIPTTNSQSENMNTLAINDCAYVIQSNPGATIFNTTSECDLLQITNDGGDIHIDEALAIATDTKVYVEFPALAHWYDSKRLYEYLTYNMSLLNSYSVLQTFYDNITNDAIAQEQQADEMLRDIIESFAMLSPAQQQAQLEDAGEINNDIDNTELQNENEQIINAIYLNILRYGLDSLKEDDKIFINYLALQCPYIGGSAVYKARTLNYYLEPGAMYDDMKTCNAVGVYRTGDTSNNGESYTKSHIRIESNLLTQIKSNIENVRLKHNELIVYPTPTNEILNIRYSEGKESRFVISDITDRIIMTILLPSGENNKTEIIIGALSAGVYNYKQVVNGVVKHTGKLIKE